MADSKRIRLGTRSSPLARWQADWVMAQLQSLGVAVEQVMIKTTGDLRQEPIGQLQTQGVFTKQIQRALLDDEIDVAVHSLKDLPTQVIPDLYLAAVPIRGPIGDVLITQASSSFQELPPGSVVATGSLRRRCQLLAARPDLKLAEVRGNIQTRIGKLHDGQFDALVLAEAALSRLQLNNQVVEVFDKRMMLPAVGQGALGLEVRRADHVTRAAIEPLNHTASYQAVCAERALLKAMRGGCLAPLGAWAHVAGDQLALEAAVFSVDGQQRVDVRVEGAAALAEELGREAADKLLSDGAGELIEASRRRSS